MLTKTWELTDGQLVEGMGASLSTLTRLVADSKATQSKATRDRIARLHANERRVYLDYKAALSTRAGWEELR